MPVSEIEREIRKDLSSMDLTELRNIAYNSYNISTDFLNRAEIIEQIVSVEIGNYVK